MKQKIRRAVAVTALAAFLTVTAVLAGISLFLESDRGQRLVQSGINDAVAGSLSWSQARCSLWRGELEILNFSLHDPGNRQIAGFDRLHALFSRSDLVRGVITLKWISLERPWAVLTMDEEGGIDIVRALEPVGGGPETTGGGTERAIMPRNVVVKEARLVDGSFSLALPSGSGRLEAGGITLRARGNLLDERALLRLALATARFYDGDRVYSLATMALEGSWNRGNLENLSWLLETEESRALLRGRVTSVLTDPDMDLSLETSLCLDELGRVTSVNPILSGVLETKAFLRGRPDNPHILLSVNQRSAHPGESPADFIDGSIRLEDREIFIDPVVLGAGTLRARITGIVSVKEVFPEGFTTSIGTSSWNALAYRLELEQEPCPLAQIHPGAADIEGVLTSTMTIRGRGIDPGRLAAQAEATVRLDGLRLPRGEPFPSLRLQSDLAAGAGKMTVETSLAMADEEFFSLSGALDLVSEALEGTAGLNIARLEKLAPAFGAAPLKGSATVEAMLGGTLHAPSARLEIRVDNLETGLQSVRSFRAFALLEEQGLTVTSFQAVTAPGETIEGSGRIGMDRTFQGAASTRGISFSSLDILENPKNVTGTILFDMTGSGTFADPVIDGTLSLTNLSFNGQPHTDCTAGAGLRDGIVRLQARAGFSLDASYVLDSGDFSATLESDALDLAPWFHIAGFSDMEGRLTARLNVLGNAGDPLNSAGRAELRSVLIESADFGSLKAEDVVITCDRKEITLPRTTLYLSHGRHLTLEGSLDLDGPLSIAAEGDFPLSPAGSIVEDLDDLTGSAAFSARVTGTLADPDISADLVIRNGGFRVYSVISPVFHGINGTIRFRGSTVTIDGIQGFMDSGTVAVNGTVLLRNLKPAVMDVTLEGRDIPIEIPDTMNGRLHAFLSLKGRDARFDLTGDITLLEALYYRDVTLRHISDAVLSAARGAPPPPARTDDLLDSVTVNLSIGHRTPLLVNNNIAHMELVPDLRVSGTPARPVVNGRIFVRSGAIYYQRREFAVRKGVVDFLNPYRTEAVLDIESTVSINQRRITLLVTGPPDLLVFNLSSEPPEEQGELLSLLLTGKTTRELTGGSGDMAQTTAAMVASIINAAMAEDVRQTTGLDIFEVEAIDTESDLFSDRFRVTLGKELSRRLAVKYSFQTEQGELVQRVSTEYRLLEHILAAAFQDNTGVFGGGLRFRLEFY
ncbi:MAG: translocation/assembly module TamB [Syntrophales bacterium]|jgi:hypothetical protein|nr:translocation/assembly module TamB [Syntrophales bacterium]MCK9528179.1 translocation/assembly module TamB [Syntrophales bacterium]MDX9921149.1 translocation/assembly module TamB domain-containing protein [Syntrophales bacterium]